jgi:hypothetical protein
MDDAELDKLIDAWTAYYDDPESDDSDDYWWAVQQILDWSRPLGGDPKQLWQFILVAYKRNLSDGAVENLAAGVVENLLGCWGDKFIDRVEILAKEDEKFNDLPGGVWQGQMSDDIWATVQRLRRTEW